MNSTPRLENRTGRALKIFIGKADNVGRDFPTEGQPVKFKGMIARGETVPVDGVPVSCAAPGLPTVPTEADFENLPAPQPGVVLIVPQPVAVAGYAMGRRDLVSMGPGRFDGTTQIGAEGFQYQGLDSELHAFLAQQA
jgi:hypothetical protein